MKTIVYTHSWNEEYMMPFFLRHYTRIVDKIVVYDGGSTDRTRNIVKSCRRAELRDGPAKLDDYYMRDCWQNYATEAARQGYEWIIGADVDELLWCKEPFQRTLTCARIMGIDMLIARGFNLVPDEPPQDDGSNQFYNLAPLGVTSANYTKGIVWNPACPVKFDFGRHVIQSFGGRMSDSQLRLFHCHFLGVEHTAARNQRNYERAVEKRFAWNYAPEHNTPTQPGSVEWVKWVIDTGQRVDVRSCG